MATTFASGRGQTFIEPVTLVTETCCSCGVLFAMPADFRNQCLRDRGPRGKRFYCPAGHDQYFTGKTEAEMERERAEEAERRLAAARRRTDQLLEANEAQRRQHAATKGQLTKTRKRIAHGVCPCCNRTFADVARHMSTQHPDYGK